MSYLELAQRVIRGELPHPPVANFIGFQLAAIDAAGTATVTFQPGPQHANPMGTLHGGILADIADAAMAWAFGATMADGESMATSHLNIQYLRPVWQEPLTAIGVVIHRGRSSGVVECTITDERNRLIAKATSTCMILQGEQAKGR